MVAGATAMYRLPFKNFSKKNKKAQIMAMTNVEAINRIRSMDLHVYGNLSNLIDMCIAVKEEGFDDCGNYLDIPNLDVVVENSKIVRNICLEEVQTDLRFMDLYWKALHTLSRYDFDSYMIYMERERPAKNRFYLPRRDQLIKIGAIQLMQDMEDDKLDVGGVSVVPGAGKTTVEEFFITWVIGRHIDDYSIFASHSGSVCRMFYDAVSVLTGTPEYKFAEIFPECKLYSTNAKDMQINFGKYKPFKSLSCVSIGQNLAGRVRANRYLLNDDLISGIEEAVSKPRLDKVWQAYAVDLLQRRIDKCKEFHFCTRWSVHDVVGRLKIKYAGNPRARFIAVPDIDPVTGESNFNYKYGVGFSKEYFEDVANTMDDVSYRCLYKNEPIEREGLLYPEDSLRRYITLPDKDPDAVIGICDTKAKGTDYMFLPCFYQYGNDYYMHDCICSDESDYEVQYQRIADLIIKNKMQMVDFESNSGGDRVATEVEKRIQGQQACGITMHYTTQNKETKIIVNAEWVKKHCLFKDKSLYAVKSDYGIAMGFLMSYTVAGKNIHDDVPDGLAQFAQFTGNLVGAQTEIFESPF